ncbi:hypothetical protein BJX76DRAFT_335503 [Aspergillus varians]
MTDQYPSHSWNVHAAARKNPQGRSGFSPETKMTGHNLSSNHQRGTRKKQKQYGVPLARFRVARLRNPPTSPKYTP